MLKRLEVERAGPAPRLELDFSQRINFLTGDNGLGKTFLLDIAWWALTRTWAHMPAAPRPDSTAGPSAIRWEYTASRGLITDHSEFDREAQRWSRRRGRPAVPGMVIYAQVDGSFSVWDPARNYLRRPASEGPDRPPAFLFSPQEVWDGLSGGKRKKLCNGLILDLAAWQREQGAAFSQFKRVLARLSPSEDEALTPGHLTRVSLDDVRDHPTLSMPYGHEVALVHASAGIRRIVALAYLLVWTWQEHERAAQMLGTSPAREIVFLIDEVEAHLHPQWQRCIVPALLDVMEALTGEHDIPVQLIMATHSPLVLASVEPYFDEQRDGIWELELKDRLVSLQPFPWRRCGDVNSWLSSSLFGLGEPRSRDAEKALVAALELLRQTRPAMADIKRVDDALRSVLSEVDSFFIRWTAFVERQRQTR